MQTLLVALFIHGIVIGGMAALLIWKVIEGKKLKRQYEIMYYYLDKISNGSCLDYDPDASVPDDQIFDFFRAARASVRRMQSNASMALNWVDELRGCVKDEE